MHERSERGRGSEEPVEIWSHHQTIVMWQVGQGHTGPPVWAALGMGHTIGGVHQARELPLGSAPTPGHPPPPRAHILLPLGAPPYVAKQSGRQGTLSI
ncbi:hypothetical protein DPEC_G00224560 [Dallia pectoralis]|uniref:Uncharacterized protein n=1 Tax=Dallia pectoralis TaxID=75939 RepID=A0ACC2G099_DALPE|nr:hypothetical protein DPEC_G00224560 [Dallia pectoralis]